MLQQTKPKEVYFGKKEKDEAAMKASVRGGQNLMKVCNANLTQKAKKRKIYLHMYACMYVHNLAKIKKWRNEEFEPNKVHKRRKTKNIGKQWAFKERWRDNFSKLFNEHIEMNIILKHLSKANYMFYIHLCPNKVKQAAKMMKNEKVAKPNKSMKMHGMRVLYD